MSPDENHIGDNDLYTNLLAMWVTNGMKWPAKPTYKLPKDDKSFLTYDNDPVRGYKQAAALLACYPLQYPPAEAQTKTMLERFAPKTNANGPAMTDSIHALLWARIGEPDKGYEEWRKGWFDFTRHPLMMFSEKRKSARTYFATGAGGSLQTVLYGFAGLRLDYKEATGAAWSRPLAGGKMLSVKPSLPPNWKRVRLRGITLPGGRYDFDIAPGKVSVAKVQS
jgi:trehalose/maltose hydrolase-like predicted phosphorylase